MLWVRCGPGVCGSCVLPSIERTARPNLLWVCQLVSLELLRLGGLAWNVKFLAKSGRTSVRLYGSCVQAKVLQRPVRASGAERRASNFTYDDLVDMSKENDFDATTVNAMVAGTQFAGAVHHLASVGSTNAVAIEAAQQGVRAGVWVADEQTAGRGRAGHRWHSAVGEGLYLSVLMRPALAGVDVLKLSLAAGLAARSALAANASFPEDRIDLRWPNDLMLWGRDGVERKFGGILTESAIEAGTGALAYAVIGIGMNLNHVQMPEDLRDVASSLRMEGAGEVARGPLVGALLDALEQEVDAVEREARGPASHPSPLAVRFAEASTWVLGVAVQVAEDDGYTGVTAGLDAHGLLRVRLQDGSERTVRHGGVRRLPGW